MTNDMTVFSKPYIDGLETAARFCEGMQTNMVTDADGNEKPLDEAHVARNEVLAKMARDIRSLKNPDHWFYR